MMMVRLFSKASQLEVGDEFIDNAFLSCSVHIDRGFKEAINFVIVVPKGSQGFYVEPLSHYTDNSKYSHDGQIWDGQTKETMGCEREWVGQRGSKLKVIRKEGNTIHMQLVGQSHKTV